MNELDKMVNDLAGWCDHHPVLAICLVVLVIIPAIRGR